MNEQAQVAEETPIACLLTGDELAERGGDVSTLFEAVEQVRELADGYEFRFPGDDTMAGKILQFTLEERRCCPFFTFELAFEPNSGAIWVRLRGSSAVKEFVADAWGAIIAAHA